MLLHIIKKEKDINDDNTSTRTLDENISKLNSYFSQFFKNEG